jgi:tRNA (guanine-N7-)-methyltransferase
MVETMNFSTPYKKRDYRPPQLPIPRNLVQDNRAEKLVAFVHQSRRLVCEIGCGVGLHPLMYARQHTSDHIIAIERTKEKFEKFQRRYVNHQSPKNLFPVHADAEAVFNLFIPDDSISELYLMYPNPEVKNPSRRWMRMPFFEKILQKMKPNGEIVFVTNSLSYFEELKNINTQIWQLNVLIEKKFSIVDSPLFLPRTHFEKKYFISGHAINEIRFSKDAS